MSRPSATSPASASGPGDPASEPQHPVWPLVPALFAALYDSIAAHSRHGLNVVTDIGHHDQEGRGILADCARRFDGLPVLFVGLHCPLEVIMQRRKAAESGLYEIGTSDAPIPATVRRFQREVHRPGIYDLELDTPSSAPASVPPPSSAASKTARPLPPSHNLPPPKHWSPGPTKDSLRSP